MDGRMNERTNVRMDGNLHAYVFLLKQVRQKEWEHFKGEQLCYFILFPYSMVVNSYSQEFALPGATSFL